MEKQRKQSNSREFSRQLILCNIQLLNNLLFSYCVSAHTHIHTRDSIRMLPCLQKSRPTFLQLLTFLPYYVSDIAQKHTTMVNQGAIIPSHVTKFQEKLVQRETEKVGLQVVTRELLPCAKHQKACCLDYYTAQTHRCIIYIHTLINTCTAWQGNAVKYFQTVFWQHMKRANTRK